ncbi:hypothetical protein N0V84_008461 [Fusarium piperis]|uniref:Sulfatase N-terminal domain-containing protein n=1 Tax=Fusarium piperis TaxID=1435070 RepID=A0A9W8W865_9HYPO|nr:hypothetical protein N0V84_008461 [Fusarium piperis]
MVEFNDRHYRGRLQALQAVDELVEGLMERLEEHGVLGNTYIFYKTDNGYHISQHHLQPGKECSSEEDINIRSSSAALAISEGKRGFNGVQDKRVFNNTYKALRVVGQDYNLYYSV